MDQDKEEDEVLMEDLKRKTDTQIFHTTKENKQKLYNYVLRWTDEIDNFSYIMTMHNKEEQETARSIQNLLERAMDNWKSWEAVNNNYQQHSAHQTTPLSYSLYVEANTPIDCIKWT